MAMAAVPAAKFEACARIKHGILTKIDEESAISLPLILRHGHDARDVILLLTMFFLKKTQLVNKPMLRENLYKWEKLHDTNLGEISDKMTPLVVVDSQSVEQERFDVVVQGFVIQEQLGKKAEILAIYLAGVAIDFENRQVVPPVHFRRRRMSPRAFFLNMKYHFIVKRPKFD